MSARKGKAEWALLRRYAGGLGLKAKVQADAAKYGIDPNVVSGMKQPGIFREVGDDQFSGGRTKQNAVADFNKKTTADLTPSERAVADSKRVSQSTLDDIAARLSAKGDGATLPEVLKGDAGPEVLRNLVKDGVVTTEEMAGLQNKAGRLTDEGKDRISQLMLGRFFDDPAHLDSMAPAMRAKLERIAPALARVEGGDYNLSTHMQHAIALLEEAKSHGLKNPEHMASQYADLFSGNSKYSPESISLAKSLQSAKTPDLAKAANAYVTHAADASHFAGGGGLFGVETKTPAEAFGDTFGKLGTPPANGTK